MLSMLVTLDVSKEERSRLASFEHPENIPPMPVTFDVSNDERSSEAREEQPENMEDMPPSEREPSFTFDVSSDVRLSSTSFEHPENMLHMSVTCEVSKEDRSREAREEQP